MPLFQEEHCILSGPPPGPHKGVMDEITQKTHSDTLIVWEWEQCHFNWKCIRDRGWRAPAVFVFSALALTGSHKGQFKCVAEEIKTLSLWGMIRLVELVMIEGLFFCSIL